MCGGASIDLHFFFFNTLKEKGKKSVKELSRHHIMGKYYENTALRSLHSLFVDYTCKPVVDSCIRRNQLCDCLGRELRYVLIINAMEITYTSNTVLQSTLLVEWEGGGIITRIRGDSWIKTRGS